MRAEDLLRRLAPEQRLLLRSVLCEGDAAREAFVEWRQRVDIDVLDPHSNRLLPLLARRLNDIAPDDPLRARIRGIYRHAWVKNQLITRDAAAAATALQERGVDVMVLKGGALLPYYGFDWGARPMFDVDVLVSIEHLTDALDALDEQGWHPRYGVSPHWIRSRVVPRRHSFPLTRGPDQELDLHWRVLSNSLGRDADAQFWRDAVPMDMAGVEVRVLSQPDLLLHVVAHGAMSDKASMQWIADAVHVLRDSNGELGDRLTAQARRHGVVELTRAALEAIQRAVDDPSVEPALARLAQTRSRALDRTRGSIAHALRRHGGGGEGIIRRGRGAARAGLDLAVVNKPGPYLAYVASGRRPGVGRLVRRLGSGPIARPPVPDASYELGEMLDFRVPVTSDRHAGFGWWKVDTHGLASHGREARIVVAVPRSERDLELELDLRSHDDSQPVEVRVNDKVLGRLDVTPDDDAPVRTRVPAALTNDGVLEIALLAPRRGLGRRPKVGVRLVQLKVTAA